MARRAAAGLGSLGRACARTIHRGLTAPSRFAAAPSRFSAAPSWLSAGAGLIALIFPAVGRAEPVKGEATFSAGGGFARLVLKLADDVESEVVTAGSIIVIRFKRPVDISIDQLSDAVPDYVGSARRDPDGMAIRLSLSRRVTVNTMTAGERTFVDFLPDSWKGPPPGRRRARTARPRAPRRTRIAPAAGGRRSQEAAADAGPRVGAADLRSFH